METIKKFSDFNLVAVLKCNGFKECSPPVLDGIHVYFHFLTTPELDKEILSYLSGETKINPIAFGHFLRDIRRVASEIKGVARHE